MHTQATQIFEDQENLIGRGAFGRVYKIENQTETCALKIIDKHPVSSRNRQIQREIAILSKIKHQNIIGFRWCNETNKNYEICMDFCPGQNLRRFLLSDLYKTSILKKKQSAKFGVKVSLDIINALVKVRSFMVSNRDIKPDNIMVKTNKDNLYTAIMLDFGQAKYHLLKSMSAVGTSGYMSPQTYFQLPYTDNCDCWSLGMTFYQIFQGVCQQSEYLLCPFSHKFRAQSEEQFRHFYQTIIFNQICFDKQRTPSCFRKIINGFLNPNACKRMTMDKALFILATEFQALKPYFGSSQQFQTEKQKILSSLVLEKQNLKHRSDIITKIQAIKTLNEVMFEPAINYIRDRIPSPKITNYLLHIIAAINTNAQQIAEIMQVDIQYVFYEILADQINLKLYEQIDNKKNWLRNISIEKSIKIDLQCKSISGETLQFIKEVCNKDPQKIVKVLDSFKKFLIN